MTPVMSEQDLLMCWNELLMTLKQKYLLAGLRSQPKLLKSLHLCCHRGKRQYDCSLIHTERVSLIESARMP